MAVDRGGLQYTVSVKDAFSASIGQFVTGIQQAKAEFAAFRAEVQKGRGVASVIGSAARASQSAARATAKATDQQTAALKRLAAQAKKQAALERESSRLRSTATRDALRNTNSLIRAEERRLRTLQTTERARERNAQRILAAMRRDEAAFHSQQLRQIQELAARRADAERQRLQLARAAAAERARLERLNPEVQGGRRAEDLIRARATAQEAIASLRRLGREDLITSQLRRQAGELKASARSANSLLFTFRRLVGVLAAFQIARALVGGFREIITLGVRFNDQIQQAEIGITGLIVALSDVRDEQGRSVTLAEEFARAQTVARKQVALLRQDALLTTATFEQLLDTFQIAIAPGFAAGLNLDEIRRLSVSISQAATAIGVPQNQLAEEIRSLLSGTIQARTTRIATALQITNADIRRLRESGELFDFLEERFQALGVAAERAARQTLSGIGALVRDALGAILGSAAEPLFQELIKLGNEVFDQVLTIRDATGQVRPRPEAVAAFRALFDGLRDGVRSARALAKELGFEGLRNIVGTIGTGLNIALQAAIGFAGSLGRAFGVVVGFVRQLSGLFGDANASIGETSRLIGRLVADFLILRTVGRLFGVQITDALNPGKARAFGAALRTFVATPLGKGGLVGLALGGVLKGFELILESILGINLGLKETAVLLAFGLGDAIDGVVTGLDKSLVVVAGKIKELFVDDEGDAAVKERVRLLLQGLDEERAARVRQFVDEIERITAAARGEQPAGAPPDRVADPDRDKRLAAFGENVSNVESIVAKAAGTISELEEDLRQLAAEFDAAGKKTGATGFAEAVEDALAEASVQVSLKSREIRSAIAQVAKQIEEGARSLALAPDRLAAIQAAAAAPAGKTQDRALAALQLNEEEGRLVSLLRDEAILRDTLLGLEEQSLQAARLKVGIAAREALPELRREVEALQQQAVAEGLVADAVSRRLGARRLAAVEAANELAAFRQQVAERLRLLQQEFEAARRASAPATGIGDPEERAREKARSAAAAALAVELEKQLRFETDIAKAKELQLRIAEEQARLAAEGSFTAGIRAGFVALADELPNLFDAAKNIVQGIVNSFVSAVSQTVRDILDPRTEVDLRERLGNLLLDIGQQILEQAISTLIQQAIQFFITRQAQEAALFAQRQAQEAILAGQRIATETAIAVIRAGAGGAAKGGLVTPSGFAEGGRIPRPARIDRVPSLVSRARGYARGGAPFGRAPGISSKDTVPAWLQPGEFVIRKAVVDSLGAGFFRSVNAGEFTAPARAPSGEGALGMIDGGRVTRREPARAARGTDNPIQIVPAVVTTEREMDRLQAGGKNASLRFMRENAGTIRGILGV